MPTPYQRYMKGYQMAADLMAQKKQLGFQERGLELRERGLGIQEERFGLEEEKWKTMEDYYKAQTEKLGRPDQPDTELEYWLSQNPGKTVTDYWRERAGIAAQFKTYAPTEAARNYQQDILRHRRAIGRQEQATGVPQSPQAIMEMARDRAYEQKYGEKAGKPTSLLEEGRLRGVLGGYDELIDDAPNERMRKHYQMLKYHAMKKYHDAEGLPLDTSREDDFLANFKGEKVDWAKAQATYPDFLWGYIWEKLGNR